MKISQDSGMRKRILSLLSSFLLCIPMMPSSMAAVPDNGDTSFDLALFKEIASKNKNDNVLLSPYSVSSALTMTFNGSNAETKSEMARVLGLASGGDEEINKRARSKMDSLRSDKSGAKLEVANALFGRKGLEFKKDFLSTNKKNFDAESRVLDFSSPDAVKQINGWVSANTRGLIPKIIETIPASAILYLVNAIYFKGTWEHKFDKSNTRKAEFRVVKDNGRSNIAKQVDMMRMHRSDFQYFDNSEFQAINLYYKDKRLSLYIFLPQKSSSLEKFESNLDAARFSSYLNKFQKREGSLSLPRLKMDSNFKLKEPLCDLGMKLAFDPEKANFKRMIEAADNVYISQVLHKTFMELNEEGTEAAAVTAVEMSFASARMDPVSPFIMNVNRPFFFVLRDNQTGTNLFVGHVVDPA